MKTLKKVIKYYNYDLNGLLDVVKTNKFITPCFTKPWNKKKRFIIESLLTKSTNLH